MLLLNKVYITHGSQMGASNSVIYQVGIIIFVVVLEAFVIVIFNKDDIAYHYSNNAITSEKIRGVNRGLMQYPSTNNNKLRKKRFNSAQGTVKFGN